MKKVDPTKPRLDPEGDGLHVLVGGFDGPAGVGRAIEAMEARGQGELVRSESVPTRGARALLDLDPGFELGDPDPGDGLFSPVTLPEGWAKKASGHSMWSHIVDADGYRRASMFFKAAFYDRDAFTQVLREPEHDQAALELEKLYQAAYEGKKLAWPKSDDEIMLLELQARIIDAVERHDGYDSTDDKPSAAFRKLVVGA